MGKGLVVLIVLGVIGALGATQAPEMKRYLKLRAM
jgi:hypothetical protein